MDDFEAEIKNGFLDEASQLVSEVEQCFLDLENNPQDMATLEKIFRLAHNLKGSAKAVGFDNLGAFTHELESFLLQMKNGAIPVNSKSIELLLRSNDLVTKMIQSLRQDFSAVIDASDLILALHAGVSSAPAQEDQTTSNVPDQFNSQFVEENFAETSIEVQSKSEETDLASTAAKIELPAVKPKEKSANVDDSIRVSLSRLEKLLNYVGELVILQTVLREQAISQSSASIYKNIQQMGKVTKEVQDLSMSLRMVPLKQTFQKMQRIVRDTSSALNKKVNLVIEGEDTEIDKPILESLSDPLVHLVRNAVDHGVETPETRASHGKPEAGTIKLIARHQSGNLVIEIRDDGAGLNATRLKSKAIEKGILKDDTQITDREAYNLIFHPGFSTKEVVTDVSGRGVGMDVVRTNIEQLQGSVQVDTELGKGTSFRIELPLTLAIIDAMVVVCGKERYVVPLSHVHESLRPTKDDVHFVTGLGEILSLRGEKIPLTRLNFILEPSSKARSIDKSTVIVVRTEAKPFAVLVDDIIGQQQVVIKQLGLEHANLKGLSGSAILGDGRPALILELGELVKKAKPSSYNQLWTQDNPGQRGVA